MKVNRRLKVEIYDEEISGDHWPVAFLGYDSSLNQKVAVTTDYVRASEFKGDPLDYGRLFVAAPDLLYWAGILINEVDLDEDMSKQKVKALKELSETIDRAIHGESEEE